MDLEQPSKNCSDNEREPSDNYFETGGGDNNSNTLDSDDIGSTNLVIDSKHGSDLENSEDADNDDDDHDDDDDDGGNQNSVEDTEMVPTPSDLKNSPKKQSPSGKLSKKLKSEDIDEMIVSCTACSLQINHKSSGTVHVHPALGVLLCKKCVTFYNSGSFSKDENGIDEYCRWCAEGGKLLCCDFCTNAFCEGCIRRNLGRSALSKIIKMDKWHCFMCDQSLLSDLKSFCQQVVERNKELNKHDRNHRKSRPFFASPSSEMSAKAGMEICLDNSVQTIRILREATQMLRKQIAGSHTSVSAVAKVGIKLKNALKVTAQNLELIDKAVDRELIKCQKVLENETTTASLLEKSVQTEEHKRTETDKNATEMASEYAFANDSSVIKKSNKTAKTNTAFEECNMEADNDGMAFFTDSDDSSPKTDPEKSDNIAKNVSNAISLVDNVISDAFEENGPAILNQACDPLLSSTPCSKSVITETEHSDDVLTAEAPDSESPGLGSLVVKSSDVVTDLHDMGNPLHSDALENLQPLCDANVPQLSEAENPSLPLYPSSKDLKSHPEKCYKDVENKQKGDFQKKKNERLIIRIPKKDVLPHMIAAKFAEDEFVKNSGTNNATKKNSKKLPQVDAIEGEDSKKKDKVKKSVKHATKKGLMSESQENEDLSSEPEAAIVDEMNVNFKPIKPTPVITEIIETHELLSRLSSAMPENIMTIPSLGEHDLDREAEVVLPDEQENSTQKPDTWKQGEDHDNHHFVSPTAIDKSLGDGQFIRILHTSNDKPMKSVEDNSNGGKHGQLHGKETSVGSLDDDDDDDTILNKAENLLFNSNTDGGDEEQSCAITPNELLEECSNGTAIEHHDSDTNKEPLKKKLKMGLTSNGSSKRKDFSDVDTKGRSDEDLENKVEGESSINLPEGDKSPYIGEGDLIIAEIPQDSPSEDNEMDSAVTESDVKVSLTGVKKEVNDVDQNAIAKKDLAKSLLLQDSSSDSEDHMQDTSHVKMHHRKKTLKENESSESDVQVLQSSIKSTTTSRKHKSLEAGLANRNHRKALIVSDSSSSEDTSACHQATMLVKLKKDVHSLSDVSNFLKTDPKLNSKAIVVLKRLNAKILKQLSDSGVVVFPRKRQNLNETKDLDKDIARLCNLSSLKMKKVKRKEIELFDDNSDDIDDNDDTKRPAYKDKKSKEKNSHAEKPKKMKKPSALFTSSDEDDSDKLDDDDDVQVALAAPKALKCQSLDDAKTMNDRAKEMLANMLKEESDELSQSGGSSSDSAADSKVNSKVKNKKEMKANKQDENESGSDVKALSNNDSDSDFVPSMRKGNKRFSSALLRAPLSDDDSDVSYVQKSSDSRDGRRSGKTRKRQLSSPMESLKSSDDSDSSIVLTRKTRRRKSRRGAKSDDSDSHSGTKKKKRRRIREASPDTSDTDDEDAVNKFGTPSGKGGRKNIRKLIKDTKLREDTKFAAREEEERKKRVASLQKIYNEVVEESTAGRGGPVTTKLVLAKDPATNESLVEVHPDLIRKLKPHQVEGVKFLWESVCETLERMKTEPGSGCILAHCMGLGKTLQIISFLHTLLSCKKTNVKTALVVCPLNTVVNWYSEFQMWLEEIHPSIFVMELSGVKGNYERARAMKNWSQNGGVLILGYNMFRTLVQETGKRIPRSCRDTFQRTLIDPGPDIVVCDEGHILKNSSTAISKAMNRISTRRRVVLTGTPLQNNLSEYHCMVDFVKKNLLGTVKEFQNRFVNPIQNGQCADSTSFDVRLMKRRAHILHNLLDGCVQRRDYNVLTPFLPPKHEYVISIKLTDLQVKLYQHYLDNMARKSGKNSLFPDYQSLMRIWTHPWVIRLAEIRQEERFTKFLKKKNKDMKEKTLAQGNVLAVYQSEGSFINDDSETPAGTDSDNVICLDDEPSTSKGKKDLSSEDEVVNNWKSSSRGGKPRNVSEIEIDAPAPCTNWWTEFVSEEDVKKIEHSGKILILFDILRECTAIGDKVLVFSQSLLSLNLIEEMLRQSTELADKNEEESEISCGRWLSGIDYFRLDGESSADQRYKCTSSFNDPDNYRARLFLISTRAGSLGINLVAANRVIVFDASWNPTHDVQSIFRVYRFGQEKPVYVYRLIAQGTMEEKIYDRQVTKQSLACRVVDEQQIERHFNFADLQELYTLNLSNVSRRPTPMVPKDRLLAELLRKRKEMIVTYHEHDSLLINQEEEVLTEEERKAAWVEFEAERQGMLNEIAGATPGYGINFKVDMSNIIQEIQRKNPGLSIDDLKTKLHDTVAMLHAARQKALEKERQEQIMRLQQQQQQQNQQQRDAMLMKMLQNQGRPPAPFQQSVLHNMPNVLQHSNIDSTSRVSLPVMSSPSNIANFMRATYSKVPYPNATSNPTTVIQPETRPSTE